MRKMRPQKQLLQFVMLSLLSVVSVLVMSGESFAAMDCASCHGDGVDPVTHRLRTGTDMRPRDTPPGSDVSYRNITTGAIKGSHQTHVSATLDATKCQRCHNNDGNYTTHHRDGQISLKKGGINGGSSTAAYSAPNLNVGGTSPNEYVFKNQTSVPTLGSCSNVNCHFESQTPVWGTDPASITCDTCHSSSPTTGSHTHHIAQYTLALGDFSLVCEKCHVPTRTTFQHATSVGRKIDLSNLLGNNPGSGYSGSRLNYLPSQSGSRVFGSCNTVYCHSSGQSSDGASATPASYSQPEWSKPSSGACGTCHAVGPAVSNPPLSTGSHSKHLAKYPDCGNCHSGGGVNTMNSANHVNTFINVSGNLNVSYGQGRQSARGNGYDKCSNAVCHSPYAPSTAAPKVTPVWGTGATCDSCHEATPTTGAHSKHLAMTSVVNDCTKCHTASTADTHINGQVNVIWMSSPVDKHAPGVYSATCSVYCHNPYSNNITDGVTTPTWGAKATCSSCHAAPPATGSHSKHLAATQLNVACGNCHTGAVINVSGGPNHGNGVIDVSNGYPPNVAKHASGSGYSSCSASTCHNAYGTSGIATPIWGTTATCSSCHDAPPATGSHADHLGHTAIVSCGSCHSGAVLGTTGGDNHLNGTINVTVGGYPTNVAKHTAGSGYSNCSNVSCHTGGNGTSQFVAPAVTWGQALHCDACHGYPPSSSYHSTVQPGTCNGCHSNVKSNGDVNTPLADAFVDRNVHMNGVVDGGKCNACHGYPPVASMAGLGVDGNYSSARLENYSGGGGMHSVAGHLPLTTKFSNGLMFTPCLTCHPSTSHNQGAGVFKTENVQISVNPKYKFDKNRPIVYAKSAGPKSTGNCTNVACHFQKTPLWSSEPYTQGH